MERIHQMHYVSNTQSKYGVDSKKANTLAGLMDCYAQFPYSLKIRMEKSGVGDYALWRERLKVN